MKVTRKISPMLMGVVAVLVGCSMMGAAVSVIISQTPSSSVANVTVAKAITMTKGDVDTNGLGFCGQDYPYLDDLVTPAVGATYDIMIKARTSADLPNVVFYFKITKTAVDEVTPAQILASDVVVKEYQGNISTSHWTPLSLESYGDYVLGTFALTSGYPSTANGMTLTAGWSDAWAFTVQFTTTGAYTFEWYATSM